MVTAAGKSRTSLLQLKQVQNGYVVAIYGGDIGRKASEDF